MHVYDDCCDLPSRYVMRVVEFRGGRFCRFDWMLDLTEFSWQKQYRRASSFDWMLKRNVAHRSPRLFQCLKWPVP
jgi:hypothetical protein